MDSREELIARFDKAAQAWGRERHLLTPTKWFQEIKAEYDAAKAALATPSPEAPMSEHTISVLSDGQDHEEIHFDGKYVMGTNHDEHGWSGMEVVRNFAEKLAELAGWKYVEGNLPVEGGTDAPE